MTDEAHLTAAPDAGPIDLRHLDSTLGTLRRAERALSAAAAGLAEARALVTAAPDDSEARRRVRMAWLHLRGEAAAVAAQLSALGREGAP